MGEKSRLWPIIRAVANALNIEVLGFKIGPGILVDIEDQRDEEQFQQRVTQNLDAMREDTSQIVTLLQQQKIDASLADVNEATLAISRSLYLKHLAGEYIYADFKGIEQMEKLVPLRLDDVFVDLKVRPEPSVAKPHERELDLLDRLDADALAGTGSSSGERPTELMRRLQRAAPEERTRLEAELAELDAERLHGLKAEAQPQPIDRVLSRGGGLVLLGGPGSGKTTLVKRLARSCALGPDVLGQRYPQLPWCLPIVVPIAEYDDRAAGRGIYDYLETHLEQIGGQALVQVFRDHWAAGACLLLLDGLDEVADTGRRIGCARAVGELLGSLSDNRVVITSRPIGYRICRVSVPCEHVLVEPFDRGDIETFARNWHLAYDRAVHPEHPNPQQAETDARELMAEIEQNPRVESLATNPLMLTIIALIKQQQVTLPERRVELYEIALNTLIRSWNKARSLANRPVGASLSAEETKKVWAAVAFWMHGEKSTGTCSRAQLQRQVVEVLLKIGRDELEAEKTAESYIQTAAEHAGLLEERGANVFAFMHQTFQEYLAARYLAMPHRKVIDRVLQLAGHPRWHEVIRLAAGFIGVVQEDDEMVTELVKAIAEEDRSRLEPYLCTSLRLAASCIADQVRVEAAEVDRVVAEMCRRLGAARYGQVIEALAESLSSLGTYTPDGPALDALIALKKYPPWGVRMAAARLLARAADRREAVAEHLARVLADDDDSDVKAHAACGLWRAGQRHRHDLLRHIAHGLTSSHAKMRLPPEPELVAGMLDLLQDDDVDVRRQAARVLGQWGPQTDALPVMRQLLQHDSVDVRLQAAEVLGQWGQQNDALPVMLQLLQHDSTYVRRQAARVLGQWGPQTDALPVMRQLLQHDSVDVRLQAAGVLGQWGLQTDALPVMRQLLQHDSAYVRRPAARVLGQWGLQTDALPVMRQLLQDDDVDVRLQAAGVLGQWGLQTDALPVILQFLQDDHAGVRLQAAGVLGQWGLQTDALPVILQLLQHDHAYVRLQAAEVLGQWGPQNDALPVMLQLLQDDDADVRRQAARVLGQWGPGDGLAATVLGELVDEGAQPAAGYLERLADVPFEAPEEEVTRLLVHAIEPQPDDTPRIEALRQVVFQWLWQAAEAGR